MALEDFSADENTQVVRRVYEKEDLNTTASLSKVFRLEWHVDDVSGKNIILWDDILAAFKDVVHVRVGEKILPFLKGRNFKTLDPLRIAAIPGVTLDVVVTGQLVHPESTSSQEAQTKSPLKELSLRSLQNALPTTPHEHNSVSSNSLVTNTIRRNPAYGLVEEALENYTHIENPATAPARRGPQVILNNQSPANHDDDPKAQNSPNKTQQNAGAPQENAPITTLDFAESLMKAAQGDKDAQVDVGDMYRKGQVVAQDYQAAMDWYLKATGQKDPVGQRRIGYIYDCGLGVAQSHSTAIRWYFLAAEQGDVIAQCNIGLSYQHGQGVFQDYGKAMKWFRKAADQGHAHSQYAIGYLYEHGLGVPEDDVQAVKWYRKAAEQGHSISQFNLGVMYYYGQGIPEDKAKAMKWYRRAAEQGNEPAKKEIAKLATEK
ncbi:hypothetical protein BGZ96_006453 [Linnemannia gamsii]|uniref:HCP-like protein n=1 Tax=Linnemannia gamsii TaxID=64522 RepID=A0ABQ7K313_9FUNG|nr:hypothetical protein BGZ96_006453 [Linnemannia gamsii]